jgi:hypothetical protein
MAKIRIVGQIFDSTVTEDGVPLIPGWMRASTLTGDYDGLKVDGETQVAAVTEALSPLGDLDLTIVYRPYEVADHVLVYFDDDNQLFYRLADGKVVLRIAGEEFASAAITFSAEQELSVRAIADSQWRKLTVGGATTGSGSTVGAAVPPIDLAILPGMCFVLGPPTGSAIQHDLIKLDPGLKTFCQLGKERTLAQHPSGGTFEVLVCTLSGYPGRVRDVALKVGAAFDIETAVGEQQDMIGSIVGLPREGASDLRYRDFLRIQTKLLLAVQRVEAEWTGTCENLLAIARAFIGPRETISYTFSADVGGDEIEDLAEVYFPGEAMPSNGTLVTVSSPSGVNDGVYPFISVGSAPHRLRFDAAFTLDGDVYTVTWTVGPPIVLTNAPPYTYQLDVPNLSLDEAKLLVRFLKTATYGGVLGLVTAVLGDDSLWASQAASIAGGAVWGSESVSIPGAGVWGSIVATG